MIARRSLSSLALLAAGMGGCDALVLHFGTGAPSSSSSSGTGGSTTAGVGGSGGATTTSSSATGGGGGSTTTSSSATGGGGAMTTSSGGAGGGGAGGGVCAELPAPWSKRFGDMAQKQYGNSVAVDPSGNLVVAGVFEGKLDFGPCEAGSGLLDAAGGVWRLYIAKLSPGGCCLWARRHEVEVASNVNVVIDGAGNVLAGGIAKGTYVFGDAGAGGPLGEAGHSVFVLKLDAAGNHLWSKSLHPGNMLNKNGVIDRLGHWVTVNPANDDVLVTGDLGEPGTLSMTDEGGAHPLLPANALSRDSFVLRFDAGGTLGWSQRASEILGAAGETFHIASAAVSGNELTLAGKFISPKLPPTTVGAGNCVLDYHGHYDAFVAGLDAMSGTCAWGKGFGGVGEDGSQDLAWNGQGDLFLSGAFILDVDFGNGCGSLGVENGKKGAFVMKLGGATPECQWVRQAGVGVDLNNSYSSLARSTQGHMAFAGLWEELGGRILHLKRYDPQGNEAVTGDFPFQGDLANPRLRLDLATDAQGGAILLGSFVKSLDFMFPEGPLQTPSQFLNDNDIFLARFAPP